MVSITKEEITAVLPAGWVVSGLDFELPAALEAGEPPEARGKRREQVRLMISFYPRSGYASGEFIHDRFSNLKDYLRQGDVLVINTSGTLNAALDAIGPDSVPYEVHLSTHLRSGEWVVEIRRSGPPGGIPHFTASPGQVFSLPAGGRLALLAPYRSAHSGVPGIPGHVRLWKAGIEVPAGMDSYLSRYGYPIRYKYVRQGWPSSYYQTVYATQKGSAEMPSAGRAFTTRMITALVARGVQVLPLILHTGVASLEEGEPPYEEYFNVPAPTARAVNLARETGQRVIAVGTTVVRALESAADPNGFIRPVEGWTDVVITPQRGLRTVDGLLTGFHEPKSSHLSMLAALAGIEHLQRAYHNALEHKYLWHEFGDLHLLLPVDAERGRRNQVLTHREKTV